MVHSSHPPSSEPPTTVQRAVFQAQQRAAQLRAEAEAAAKESSIWQDLQSYQDKEWWFHLRALLERESDFFHRIRESKAPVIDQLEELFRDAKKRTDDLLPDIPRDIERMVQEHSLPLDHAKSAHPKYRFRDGFLTLEIDDRKRTARLADYVDTLETMPPDIGAIALAIKKHDQRLFGRLFNGAKFLEKVRRSYLAILKKEKKADGEPVPLRQIASRLTDNEKGYRRDEFVIDLSNLATKGPQVVEGHQFELQQTKDTNQGFLLHGPAGRGMVNLLIFRKITP